MTETYKFADVDRKRIIRLRDLGINFRHFFDIGAANGSWSALVSIDFPDATFDMFEPLVDFAPDYQGLMDRQLKEHPNFRLHKYAVGRKCTTVGMSVFSDFFSSTALPGIWEGSNKIEIPMITIDHAVKKFGLPPPRFIKMDTQGGELNILEGARRTLEHVDVILCECWLYRDYGPSTPLYIQVASWLKDRGFNLWDLGEEYRDADGVLRSQDYFFVNSRIMDSKGRIAADRI